MIFETRLGHVKGRSSSLGSEDFLLVRSAAVQHEENTFYYYPGRMGMVIMVHWEPLDEFSFLGSYMAKGADFSASFVTWEGGTLTPLDYLKT